MKSRSLTGPLIVILIGVVFLINNIRPGLLTLSRIADYWPFLLIAAGVIGLIEVLFNVSRGAPPPRPVAGAAIFWILCIGLFISLLSRDHSFPFARFSPGVSLFGSDYDYDVNAAASPRGVTRVVIDNVRGDISIKGDNSVSGEDLGDIKVTGHRTIRAFSRNDADRADARTRIRIDRDGDELLIHPGDFASPGLTQITANLDVSVPRGVSVESRGRTGNLAVEDVDGPVDISAGRGDIQLNQIAKDVKIQASRSGDIHATGVKGGFDLDGRGGDIQLDGVAGPVSINGEYAGTLDFRSIAQPLSFHSSRTDLRAQAVPGAVTMDLGSLKLANVTGPVVFNTSVRDIQAADVTGELNVNVNRGDIDISAAKIPVPKIDVQTHIGDITLSLPAGADFQLNGSTSLGDVDNEYGPPLETQDSGRRGATIHGDSATGPAVTAVTTRGTLVVKKS